MLNPYMTNYTATEEQQLTDDLIIEAIQARGVDVRYMERTHHNYNALFGEDPTSSFAGTKSIEMYLQNVQGWGGEGEMMTKFGLTIKDTAKFVVNRTRFTEEFPNLPRPREGDLLFMPYTNAIFEIKYVENESPFFQQGAQLVYEISAELFEFSHEDIDAGDVDINTFISGVLNFDPATETDAYGKNEVIEDTFQPETTFDPADPFAVK
jgi:hypothetical protein